MSPYNISFFGRIRGMINYTKKWWLLGCYRRAERIHSTRGSNTGSPVLLSQKFFIEGNSEDWKGLANKFNPYVRFRFSHFIQWKPEYSEEQLRVKRNNYHDIYEVCVSEGYITKHEGTGWPTVSNKQAYTIRGFPLGYFQGLLSQYDKVTTTLITLMGLLISFIVGALFGK